MSICKLCGRSLKKHESVERGYGKTCYNKMKSQQTTSLEDFDIWQNND